MKLIVSLLFLLVGVVIGKHGGNHGNRKPIITKSSELRICADLCTSGLGGERCGAFCQDITPKSLPKQLKKDLQNVKNNITRSDACPLLCDNGLGYPFCKCPKPKHQSNKNKKIDFLKICEHYCNQQRWWLHGCPACKLTLQQHGGGKQNGGLRIVSSNYASTDVDWGKWCDVQCANSNGGSACNCDLLPFSLM